MIVPSINNSLSANNYTPNYSPSFNAFISAPIMKEMARGRAEVRPRSSGATFYITGSYFSRGINLINEKLYKIAKKHKLQSNYTWLDLRFNKDKTELYLRHRKDSKLEKVLYVFDNKSDIPFYERLYSAIMQYDTKKIHKEELLLEQKYWKNTHTI